MKKKMYFSVNPPNIQISVCLYGGQNVAPLAASKTMVSVQTKGTLMTLKRNLEDPEDVGDGSRSPAGANGKREALEEAGGEVKDLNKA